MFQIWVLYKLELKKNSVNLSPLKAHKVIVAWKLQYEQVTLTQESLVYHICVK